VLLRRRRRRRRRRRLCHREAANVKKAGVTIMLVLEEVDLI
jgi:hypothetical protein